MGLTHEEVLINTDALCTVDVSTRKITSNSGKTTFLQNDHNSERIGFTMERYIDGHDMAIVDRIAIIYMNTVDTDMYIVDDLSVTEDKKQITFTWLISGNATSNPGSIVFQINFRCWDSEGNITYNWSTQPCSTYTILEGLYSMDANPKELYDFWARYEGKVTDVTNRTDTAQEKLNELVSDNAEFESDLNELHVKAAELVHVVDTLSTDVPNLEDRVDTLTLTVPELESKIDALDRALEDDVAYAISKDVTDLTNDFIELAGRRKLSTSWVSGVWSVDSNGAAIKASSSARIRTEEIVDVPNATALNTTIGEGYQYSIGFVDANGVRTSETGWVKDNLTFDLAEQRIVVSISKTDNSEIAADEYVNFTCDILYKTVGAADEIETLKEQVTDLIEDVAVIQNGTDLRSKIEYKTGGYYLQQGNTIGDDNKDTKFSFKDFLKVEPGSKLTKVVTGSRIYYAVYYFDIDKKYIEESGWILFDHDIEFTEEQYVKVQFKNNTYTTVTDQEKLDIEFSVLYYNAYAIELEKLKATLRNYGRDDIINSCNVEYGRREGASYVFIRIPKITNDGKTVMPKLALTSTNGSLSGIKRSALQYSIDNSCAVVMNAGLFDTTTYQPVGQTIIDGVSMVDTPMEDDNGQPISDTQCYPLCIDANGVLSAPYDRNVDTETMIIDGVTQAITGWGKLVENFEITHEDIEAEIVHQGTYIRQSIGQYQNGDYAICTVDQSRNGIENEAGLTYEALAQIFVDHGVKFAYSLDGGGSAETVVGNRQLNPIYDQATGRRIPTIISFETID